VFGKPSDRSAPPNALFANRAALLEWECAIADEAAMHELAASALNELRAYLRVAPCGAVKMATPLADQSPQASSGPARTITIIDDDSDDDGDKRDGDQHSGGSGDGGRRCGSDGGTVSSDDEDEGDGRGEVAMRISAVDGEMKAAKGKIEAPGDFSGAEGNNSDIVDARPAPTARANRKHGIRRKASTSSQRGRRRRKSAAVTSKTRHAQAARPAKKAEARKTTADPAGFSSPRRSAMECTIERYARMAERRGCTRAQLSFTRWCFFW